MQLNVNVSNQWESDGTVYNIDITFGSDYTNVFFANTSLSVVGNAFQFMGYEIRKPTGLQEYPPGPTQGAGSRGQPLNFSVLYANAPSAASKWTIRIQARTNGSYGPNNLLKVDVSANGSMPDSGSVTKTITFTKNGVSAPPPTPKGLKATAAGAAAINLAWNSISQADTIEIERDTETDFSGAPVTWEVDGSLTKTQDLDMPALADRLDPSTKYYYRIRAFNVFAEDGTDYSNIDDATTTANPDNPEAPDGVTAKPRRGQNGAHEVEVAWNSIPSLTVDTLDGKAKLTPTYQPYYATVQGGPYTAFGGPVPNTNVRVVQLLSGTTYYFVVKSSYRESPGAVSANSSEVSTTTRTDSDSPVAPGSLTAQEQSPDNPTQILLTWVDTNDGNCDYEIRRGTVTPTEVIASGIVGTTYLDTGPLAGSTEYFYAVYGTTATGNGASATVSETTGVVPPAPGVPGSLEAQPLDDSRIALVWTASTDDPTIYDIKRGTSNGGPYTTIAAIPATANPYFEDLNLTPNTTFYYVVAGRNIGGSSANSSEASATTRPRSVTVVTQSGFSFDPLARFMIRQIGGRAVYASDRDRQVVWINGCWFKAGLKRQLAGPTVNAVSGGALEDDTYKVYTKLKRSRGVVRSEESPATEVTINSSSRLLRITPTLTGGSPDKVLVRDQGFDISGNQIDGADFVEIYLRTSGSSYAYLLDTIPVNDDRWDSPGYYETASDLTQDKLLNGNRRPMEKLFENSLPPACSVIIPKDTRMIAFGETNIQPTAAEIAAGATLTVNTGDRSFTVSGYTLPEGVIYHELALNGAGTGWFVYDTEGTTGYIRNFDPTKDEAGWEGAGGGFATFKFLATPSRMYTSGYYGGEALGQPSVSPETYPPFCTFDTELFPNDNTDPVAAIVLNDALLIGKPSRWVIARGGNEINYPRFSFESLSGESGINSPRTLVKDAQDRAYYLGDTGPMRVTPAGVEKLNVQLGNQRLFEEVFDIASVPDANAVWFSREDWYVCASLDLIGNSGRRDGFVMDLKNYVLMPFSLPIQITWMEQVKNTDGEFQIEFAEKNGRVGVLFKKGLSVDGIDFGIPTPSPFATSISAYMKTGILDTINRVGIRSFQPHIRVTGGTVRMTFSTIRKDRMDDPRTEQIIEALQFDTDDTRTNFIMANHSFPNLIGRLDVELPTNPANTKFELRDLPMEVITRGTVQ